MYLECVSCPKIGSSCGGPNFIAMSSQQLLNWCRLRKKFLGWSNAKLAEMSAMPKGTIDRLLAGSNDTDFKFETIRPMIKALVGGEWSSNPCPVPPSGDVLKLEETARNNEAHLARREQEVLHLTREIETLERQLQVKDAEIADAHAQVKRSRKVAMILCSGLIACLLLVIAAMLIDMANPGMGFFWRG